MAVAYANGNGNGKATYSTIIQTVTVVSIFVAGFWVAVILPITHQLEVLQETKLSINEHSEFKFRIDRDLGEVRSRLARLEDAVVPRGEHNEHWRAVDQQFVQMTHQIETLRAELGNTYTLSDEIHRLQRDIDLLREKRPPG